MRANNEKKSYQSPQQPDVSKHSNFSKKILRFDSWQNDHERIILFGDHKKICVLEKLNFWLDDGTFKVTPKMFYQLYSIDISLSGIALLAYMRSCRIKQKTTTVS